MVDTVDTDEGAMSDIEIAATPCASEDGFKLVEW